MRVVVTGASRGIGLELVRQFLGERAQVIATCRMPEQADDLRDMACGSLRMMRLDVTEPHSIQSFCQEIGDEPIDVLINCAGVMGGQSQSVEDMDYEGWRQAFEVNTIAPFRISTALRNNLKRASNPKVVTLSSQMGALARKSRGSYAYRSSKAAVNKVMQVLAIDMAGDGIIVCPVHPGWVRTDMGGPDADISVEESVRGLRELIASLNMEHSGRFWTWDGREHPW